MRESFLFDPRAEYRDSPPRGFRLVGGGDVRIEPIAGRLPSQVLGLHLGRDGRELRLFDPATGARLLAPREGREAAERRAEDQRRRAGDAGAARRRVAEEDERLLRGIEALRRGTRPE